MSLAFPNTVLNTIVAEAIDELSDKLEAASGNDIAEKVTAVVKEAYATNKQVCFGGDNYSEEWHAEAEERGLLNLKTTPEALPMLLTDETVAAFENYDVLSERELESRYEVLVEQYWINANIEAETTNSIARTMLLPAALRHLALVEASGVDAVSYEVRPLVDGLVTSIKELQQANVHPDGVEGIERAEYARDKQLVAMNGVREVADQLEKVVADDLWPLPKYSEILFIK
jgi:glutamine synthetase